MTSHQPLERLFKVMHECELSWTWRKRQRIL